ncbi:MAG: ImmA/IrrE family metallo-endopeptidase [Oscillospiraceae bacterium]|nr:ImmA/IrrE family metallo-endopeptidase [Oscillospiraceae bacterium]
MSTESICNLADSLCQTHKTNDPYELAQALGINVRYEDLGSLKGLYTVIDGCRFILVNSLLEPETQNVVIAHETGHDLLHRDIAENEHFQEFSLFDMTSKPEKEANIFAASLIISDDDVLEYIRYGYSTDKIAKCLRIPHALLVIKMMCMNAKGYKFNLPFVPKADFLAR